MTLSDRTVRLTSYMKMIREDCEQRLAFEHLHRASERFDHRMYAIQWIKCVCQSHSMSSMSRDSAVTILDTYLALKLAKVSSLDSSFVSHAAVIALTLAFKIHETSRSLYLSSFADFELATLKSFEITMLNEMGFNLTPQVIPIGLVHELLHVWQPTTSSSFLLAVDIETCAEVSSVLSCMPSSSSSSSSSSMNNANHLKATSMNHQKTELIRIADRLIAGFWEERCSLLYAPSTIAIASLILAFSMLHLDCSEWLASLPNCCLPLSGQNQEQNKDTICVGSKYHQMFDIDACLLSFERVEMLRTMASANKSAAINPKLFDSPRILSSSPTSVTATNSALNLNDLFDVEEKPPAIGLGSPVSSSIVLSTSSSVSSIFVPDTTTNTTTTTTNPSAAQSSWNENNENHRHRLKRSATVSSLSTHTDYGGIGPGTGVREGTGVDAIDGIRGRLKRSFSVASLSTVFTDDVAMADDSLSTHHDSSNKRARHG